MQASTNKEFDKAYRFPLVYNQNQGANHTLNSDVDQDLQILGLHERPLTYQFIIYINQDITRR